VTANATQLHRIGVGEVRNVAIDFTGVLDSGEVLTGTPTVVEETTSDLTITNKVVSTAVVVINHADVPIGEAVQFRVDATSAVLNRTYILLITCDTDAGQTVKARVRMDCRR